MNFCLDMELIFWRRPSIFVRMFTHISFQYMCMRIYVHAVFILHTRMKIHTHAIFILHVCVRIRDFGPVQIVSLRFIILAFILEHVSLATIHYSCLPLIVNHPPPPSTHPHPTAPCSTFPFLPPFAHPILCLFVHCQRTSTAT